ncbi:MAG: DUF7669 domain-containing protein [Thermomicrobiales bacterium]
MDTSSDSRGKGIEPRRHRGHREGEEHTMSCRDEVLVCAKDAVHRTGKEEFTIQNILECMKQKGSRYKESTIRTHITSRLCSNAPVVAQFES